MLAFGVATLADTVDRARGECDPEELAVLTAGDADENDNFGDSVSIDGDVIVVGAPQNDDSGISSGSAYVFEKPEGG